MTTKGNRKQVSIITNSNSWTSCPQKKKMKGKKTDTLYNTTREYRKKVRQEVKTCFLSQKTLSSIGRIKNELDVIFKPEIIVLKPCRQVVI